MASLILATMSVNSLEHIFVNIFFFSNIFSHLEYMVRQRASLATAASFAERSDTRLSAPAATDLCRVLAIFHHFGAVVLGLFEFVGPCFKRCVVQRKS